MNPRTPRLLAGLLALACALGSCSLGGRPEPARTSLPAPSPALAKLYNQEPDWTGCGDNVQCASVEAPLDWDDPTGPTISLALSRRLADDTTPLGSLVVNFGGPGVAGAAALQANPNSVATPAVRAHYDLVSFDPRGTGRSAPLDCLSDRQLDDFLAFTPSTDAAQAQTQLASEAAGLARACQAKDGRDLPFLATRYAVKDLDLIRSVLDERKLNYLGYSYGTLLGARYADEFPSNVGRFVLDGALDPANSYDALVLGQAAGMDAALRRYVEACLAGRAGKCPLSGGVDQAMRQVGTLLAAVWARPFATDTSRPLTGSLALTGIIAAMYSDSSWEELTSALTQAERRDGSGLLALADRYNDRTNTGRYVTNLSEAYWAITCSDYPMATDQATLATEAQRIEAAAPTLGPYFTDGDLSCAGWPVKAPAAPQPVRAEGSGPIVVIGTTHDPATPYSWARALAGQLAAGRLLTYEGTGHTAYGRGSRCITSAVETYLLQGTPPPVGTRCR